ncbi:MAG TPA: Ig-like domain-containing protein [Gemmatimonadales bacterium]|nr:Ig-like domain-containing protein [Gemmatimonadales bacterium]
MTSKFLSARRSAVATVRLLLPTSLLLVSACGNPTISEGFTPPDPNDVADISVTPKLDTIRTSDSIQLHAQGYNAEGDTVSVSGDVDWSASGGTVSPTGMFRSSTTGSFTLLARHRKHQQVGDTARVVVIPAQATVAAVIISPASATLTTGGTRGFTASAAMSDGSSAPVSVTWSATGGSINSSGNYTAGSTAGTFRVIAREAAGSHADTATVTVNAPTLTTVNVAPGTVSLQAGGTQQFTATGTYSDGSSAALAVTWSATGGTITSGGLYTAGSTAGNYRVIAIQQGGTKADTALVGVAVAAPTLQKVILTPAASSVLTGATQQFSVSGQMSDGSTKSVAVNYTATGGTITAAGLYTAGSTAGSFTVIATQQGGTLADTSAVTVTAPVLQQVVINPAALNVQSGTIQQFSASGRMSDGSVSSVTVTWNATGGIITGTGLYTAGVTAGSFRVIATQQGGTLADTCNVTITAATLTQVITLPATVSLGSGNTQQFTVSGVLSNGSTTTPAVTWSATGGTITTGGLYTAGSTAGTFRVIALQQGGTLADTSAVTVTTSTATLTAISLTPSTTTLTSGGTVQFAVSGTMSDGSTTIPTVTYTATGGTISAGGLYTAGATAGTYRVIATKLGGTLADSSTVLVVAQDATEPLFRTGTDNMAWSDNLDRYYSLQDMQWSISECGSTLPDGHAATNYGKRTTPNNASACATPYANYYLIAGGHGGGGNALRSVVHADPNHNQQSVAWLSPWNPNSLTYSGRAIVITVWFRISAGGTPGSMGMKWLEAWFTSGAAQRVQWAPDLGTNARPLWGIVLGSNPGGPVIRTKQPVGPYWDQINDGQWHRATHLFIANTSSDYKKTGGGTTSATEVYSGTSSRDGRVAMWIDGVKMMDYSQATVGVTPQGGTGIWCTQGDVDMIPGLSGTNSIGRVANLQFPGVFNGSPGDWTLDHDDISIWAPAP